MDHKTEQDAGLLEQAATMLEEHADEQRTMGNCSAAEGAACSAHAIRRLAPAMLRTGNTHPVLDDRWKARMLDGRAMERDEMGLGDHPELPWLDEGMMPRSFYAALGLELVHTMAEDQLDGDALEAMSEAVNWTGWTPTPPPGDGWKLVSIFDTEDGPAAWWLRELPEAEDGTTTIRNLKAEVEKLEARIARAGAAPAAVAPQGEWRIDTSAGREILVYKNCSVIEDADARYVLSLIAAASQPAALAGPALDVRAIAAAVCQRVAEQPDRNSPEDWPEAMLVTGQELIDVVTCELEQAQAAPALEAPAAKQAGEPFDARLLAHTDLLTYVLQDDVHNRLTPRVIDIAYSAFMQAKKPNTEDGGPSDWFNDTKPMIQSAIDKLRHDLTEDRAALAAAPQAPAAPVDDLAQLVKQLVQALRKAAPNHVLPAKALDYLRRQGLLGSPLRAAPAAPSMAVVADEQIDAILDSPGGLGMVIADKRERMRMFARRVLDLAAPAAPAVDARDTARMNWLEAQVVNVRAPLRYGSRDMFWSSPEEVDGGPDGPSDLRARIDAAQAAAKGEA